MQTAIKVVLILALAVAVSLGLSILVESQFSMSFGAGGFSPGMALLLSARAAENGGQIAPSLDQLQSSGSLPPFMQGSTAGGGFGAQEGGSGGVAWSHGFDPAAAVQRLGKDLLRFSVALVIAIVVEIPLMRLVRRRRRASLQATD